MADMRARSPAAQSTASSIYSAISPLAIKAVSHAASRAAAVA